MHSALLGPSLSPSVEKKKRLASSFVCFFLVAGRRNFLGQHAMGYVRTTKEVLHFQETSRNPLLKRPGIARKENLSLRNQQSAQSPQGGRLQPTSMNMTLLRPWIGKQGNHTMQTSILETVQKRPHISPVHTDIAAIRSLRLLGAETSPCKERPVRFQKTQRPKNLLPDSGKPARASALRFQIRLPARIPAWNPKTAAVVGASQDMHA